MTTTHGEKKADGALTAGDSHHSRQHARDDAPPRPPPGLAGDDGLEAPLGARLSEAEAQTLLGILTVEEFLPNQIILEQGRELSHLLYKIFRCLSATELARDAGGKRREGREQAEAAERACMAIVERARAERRMG